MNEEIKIHEQLARLTAVTEELSRNVRSYNGKAIAAQKEVAELKKTDVQILSQFSTVLENYHNNERKWDKHEERFLHLLQRVDRLVTSYDKVPERVEINTFWRKFLVVGSPLLWTILSAIFAVVLVVITRNINLELENYTLQIENIIDERTTTIADEVISKIEQRYDIGVY